mmetsp:Transcript_10602/g.14051  ORF Transcript_10602/g.14051 Transcript_10602/m.14051 type:complete len:200 (+) Transcript_10602:248-847(+)
MCHSNANHFSSPSSTKATIIKARRSAPLHNTNGRRVSEECTFMALHPEINDQVLRPQQKQHDQQQEGESSSLPAAENSVNNDFVLVFPSGNPIDFRRRTILRPRPSSRRKQQKSPNSSPENMNDAKLLSAFLLSNSVSSLEERVLSSFMTPTKQSPIRLSMRITSARSRRSDNNNNISDILAQDLSNYADNGNIFIPDL